MSPVSSYGAQPWKGGSSLWRVLGKTAIARHDHLLSESSGEELLVEDHIGSWADHMECADGLAGLEPAPSEGSIQPLPGLASYHEDDDMLYIGLDVHRLIRGSAVVGPVCRHCCATGSGLALSEDIAVL